MEIQIWILIVMFHSMDRIGKDNGFSINLRSIVCKLSSFYQMSWSIARLLYTPIEQCIQLIKLIITVKLFSFRVSIFGTLTTRQIIRRIQNSNQTNLLKRTFIFYHVYILWKTSYFSVTIENIWCIYIVCIFKNVFMSRIRIINSGYSLYLCRYILRKYYFS